MVYSFITANKTIIHTMYIVNNEHHDIKFINQYIKERERYREHVYTCFQQTYTPLNNTTSQNYTGIQFNNCKHNLPIHIRTYVVAYMVYQKLKLYITKLKFDIQQMILLTVPYSMVNKFLRFFRLVSVHCWSYNWTVEFQTTQSVYDQHRISYVCQRKDKKPEFISKIHMKTESVWKMLLL